MAYLPIVIFLLLLGACVGSFLNVVVYRLPRGESLVSPGSRCPRCGTPLKWYDNLPVVGWLKLRGKCRTCREPISPRYPIVEAATALLFAVYFLMFFVVHIGPCPHTGLSERPISLYSAGLDFTRDWPLYFLYMYLLSALLAASLIDAELFIIPTQILYGWQGGLVWVGLLVHAIIDVPGQIGALNSGPAPAALAVGGGVGLLISILLVRLGKLPVSFADGGPLLEVEKDHNAAAAGRSDAAPIPGRDYSSAEIRAEMRKEMLFLLPPLALGMLCVLLCLRVPAIGRPWELLILEHHWLSGGCGALLGGLIGGFVVWFTRIAGSYVFGREAMGMGDVDLMAGVGCVIGAGPATVAFFLAPFFGMALALYMLLTGNRRELPYGPYLSLATAAALLFYCPIADYLTPGILGLIIILRGSGAR